MTDLGFTVPSETDAGYPDQSEFDTGDLRTVAGIGMGTGVISGCVVTAQVTPDDTVAVAAGQWAIRGIPVTFAGGNVNVLSGSANADGTTSSAANATYYRYDLIVGNISGQVGVIHGTVPAPAYADYVVNPQWPAYDRSVNVLLATLFIPPTAAGLTGVQTSMIVAKQVDVSAGAYVSPYHRYNLPTGAIAQTFNRDTPSTNLGTTVLQTGVLYLSAIYLPRCIATSATFRSAGSGVGTPTHWWFALYDSALGLLRQTADQTTTAWAQNTTMNKSFTTPVTITAAGLYYVGIMITASTMPTMLGLARGQSTDPALLFAPFLYGTSDGSLTTTAPPTAAAITISGVGRIYAFIS